MTKEDARTVPSGEYRLVHGPHVGNPNSTPRKRLMNIRRKSNPTEAECRDLRLLMTRGPNARVDAGGTGVIAEEVGTSHVDF